MNGRSGRAGPALERIGVRLLLAGAGSLLVHVLLSTWLALHGRYVATPAPRHEIQLEVHTVERRPPAPAPVSRPAPPARATHVPRVKRSTPALRAERSPPPPPSATAPPPRAQPPSAPAAPIRIGVALESTTSNGTFAVPAGEGAPDGIAPAEGRAGPGGSPGGAPSPGVANYVPQSQVAELPVLLEDVKAPYPPEAHRAGIEGSVVLMLTIDDHGTVARVRKISGVSPELDQAAIAAAKRFRFRPARFAGAPVATEIRYVYAFEIN